ncbi:MAG TPA: NF038122 family metalloprotease, partial [Rhizomicrobium sp.]|nr:NF038122 family metalloprotease [Rhizomicrobium sp.]
MAAASALILPNSAAAVNINSIFAPTYTGPDYGLGTVVTLSGNAAAQASIEAAAAQLSSLFTNNVTVNILYYGVHGGANGFIGANVAGQTGYSYDEYTAALAADSAAHPTNINLATAVAHLGQGNGAGDPLAFVVPTTVGARVLGLPHADPQFDTTGDFVDSGGTVDGVVFLNLDESLAFTRPLPDVSSAIVYDAETAMEHETDEVFGVGGHGSTLNDLLQDPNFAFDVSGIPGATLYGADDLYRYSNGAPSYVANPNVDFSQTAYFSIDGGATAIDSYNQEAMVFGDAADWGLARYCAGGGIGGAGNVQDAFGCSNESPDVTY